MSSWKRNYPSSGGRIALIKAFLSNLPVDFMSLLSMLMAVGGKLDHLTRDFLWEERGEKRETHLMERCEVIKPKYAGGGLGRRGKLCVGVFMVRPGPG